MSEPILRYCAVLQQQGKTPSTALLKAGLGKQFALPQLIAGLQQWKNNAEIQAYWTQQLAQAEPSNMPSAQVGELSQTVGQARGTVTAELSASLAEGEGRAQQALSEQLNRIEAKLDRLLSIIEK